MSGVTIKLDGYDELLRALDRIDDTLSKRVTRDMVKAAGEIAAARARVLCPVGDPTHHPENKPLRDTIAVEVKDYGVRALAVVGPQWPAGAHGHNVEFGHDIVARGQGKNVGKARRSGAKKKGGVAKGRTQPKPFMRPAFDSTKGQQFAAMEAVVKKALWELGMGAA
jgi:HK97 gp10 family phage protein